VGFRIEASPLAHINMRPGRGEDERCVVYIYFGDPEDGQRFGAAYGPTDTIARMRAELICMAVNDRPALQEYPSFGGAQGNGALRNKETVNASTEN